MHFPLGFGRAHARRRIDAAHARLVAHHPQYDDKIWDPPSDGRHIVLLDRWGRATLASTERGELYGHEPVRSLDELMFRLFSARVFLPASRWELARRVEGADSRERLFERAATLLGEIDPRWERCERERHARILREHPFSDRPREG